MGLQCVVTIDSGIAQVWTKWTVWRLGGFALGRHRPESFFVGARRVMAKDSGPFASGNGGYLRVLE